MQLAIKAIMYGGVDNIPPRELTQKQKDTIKQIKYEIRNGLETATDKKKGDNVGEFPVFNSNNSGSISVHTALNLCDVRI